MAQFEFDPDFYNKGLPAGQAPSAGRGLISAGIQTGLNAAASEEGAAIHAVGDLVGSQGISGFGQRAEAASQAAAAQTQRPDLEGSPFQGGIGHVIPWAAYQALKGAPQLAAIGAATALAPVAEGAAGASTLARLGFGMAGASPFALGQSYQATEDATGQGSAGRAFAMAPAVAALSSWMPGHLEGLLGQAAEGGLVKHIATHGLVTAAAQMPIAGATTALLDSANPNLTTRDRIHNIVDSAVSGGVIGGFLGAGAAGVGGLRSIRRADPGAISTDDLNTVINNVLQLPKPDQAGGPQIGSGPTMFADAAGRASPNRGEIIATPRDTGMSPTDRMIAERTIPEAQKAIDSTTIIQDKQGSLRWAKPYEQADDTSRPFRNLTDPELQSANNALLAKGDNLSDEHAKILGAVQEELSQRAANRSLTETAPKDGVGTVERSADGKSGVADQGSSAPVPATLTPDDALKGISTRKAYADAKDLDEVKARLLDRLQNGSTAKGDIALADRLGVDTNAPDKAVETKTSGVPKPDDKAALDQNRASTPEPAAPANQGGGDRPVDAEFQSAFSKDLSSRRGEALKDFRDNPPANTDEARERLFEALGKNLPGEDNARVDGHQAVVDLAKKYGVIDENERLTKVGADIARKSFAAEPDAMHQAVVEAQSRGLSGDETSAFDRGARGETTAKFNSISELKAYQDGREWAAPETAGATETGQHLEGKMADTKGKRVTSAEVPDEQRNMQRLNEQIDQVYGSTLKPQEHAQLKRMVREGADSKAIDEAARYFASGHGALVQEQPPARPFKAATLDRTPGLMRMVEQRRIARDEAARASQLDKIMRNPNDVRGAERLRTDEKLIQERQGREAYKNDLRDALKSAHDNGEITRKDLIMLTSHLVNNDFKPIEKALSGSVIKSRQSVDRREFLAGLAATAVAPHAAKADVTQPTGKAVGPQLKQHIVLGDLPGALKTLRDGSSNPTYRLIAAKLLRGDWSKVSVERVGENGEWHGETSLNDDGSSTIQLAGDQGLTEETFLHEAIHAYVQQRWAGISEYLDSNKRLLHDRTDRADDVIRRAQGVWDDIRGALEKADPNLKDSQTWAEEITANPDEMLSWVMTNKSAQEYLKQIDIHGDKLPEGGMSMWQNIMKFFADLLGLPYNGKTASALDHVMNAGYAVLDAGAGIKEGDFNVKMARAIASQRNEEGIQSHQYVRTLNQNSVAAVKLVSRQVAPKIEDRVDEWKGKALEAGIDTMPTLHLAEHYGKLMPEIPEWTKVLGERNSTSSVLAKIIQEPMDAYEKLSRAEGRKPVFTKMTNDIMAATAYGVDPRQSWKAQTHLHSDPQAALLKNYAENAYRQYQALRAAGHAPIYDGFRQALEADGLIRMSNNLHSLVSWDPALSNEVKNFGGDRLAPFRDMTDKHNPSGAAEHWKGALAEQMAAVETYVKNLRGDPTLVKEQRASIEKRLSPIESYMREIHNNLGAMRQSPYFHLYREGNDFVAAKLSTLEDGRADPASAQAVAKALGKAGFDDVHITPELANPSIYMRVENSAQRAALERAMVGLKDQGHIQQDTILAGPKARSGLVSEGTRRIIEHLMSSIESHPMFATEGKTVDEVRELENQKAALKDAVREQWLNELPFNSVNRVLAHRESVQGFSKDMVRGTYHRYAVGSGALARQWARPYVNDIFTRAGARVRAATNVEHAQHGDVDKLSTLYSNMMKRDFQQAQTDRYGMLDMVRQMTNVFYLGFSPSFGLVQLSQMGVLTLPELGARHGYSKAFGAMAKATPVAFRVLREAFTQGMNVSSARAMDAAVVDSVLKKAAPDRATQTFLAHMIASGSMDIGSFTRALTLEAGLDPNEKVGRLMRYASSIGLYSETFTRLVAALAARDLHGGKMAMPVEDYAKSVINNSLFQYQSWNTAPIIGKHGFAGPLTPLIAQFQNYNVQVAWKLYREVHDAFLNKAATAEEKSEARRFLGGHLVAMTALAGTLGLPFAAAAAGAVDKLKDTLWPGDQPFDVNAQYRDFLSDMLGKDIGEVAARGVPRALDFDFSQRTGEQNLLPFTGLLTSQRKWGDAIEQWGPQAVGAPFSMVSSVLRGTDQMKDGDVMGGMASMMPSAFRGPFKAYQMGQQGYMDGNGNKLPLPSPGATDIMVQLMGLSPEAKAEYNEARGAQQDQKAALTRTSNALKQQLMKAVQGGDRDGARDIIARAQHFDKANPAYAVLPRLEADLVHRDKLQGISEATQTPIGVSPKDLHARGLTRYANIDYQMQ